jgi:predicted alpha/beta hydrolase
LKPSDAPDPERPAEGDGLPVEAGDGHRFRLLIRPLQPPATAPAAALLWLPALGVAARHYLPFAEALARHGIVVFVHEWRGHGSSDRRAGHDCDWGYRELLDHDLPASLAAVRAQAPGLPRIVGGHSLGGQLAACLLGLDNAAAERLWLVASGAPYWPAFPRPRRWLLPLAYRFLPWLAEHRGALPGRAIGFGGTEARSVMRDWARTGLRGRYAGAGMARDLEAALRTVTADVDAVLCADDWLAPRSSLDVLLGKMRPARLRCTTLDAAALGTQADHFAWMRRPDAVARALAAGLGQPSA